MPELVEVLPRKVLDFIAECRTQVYDPEAIPTLVNPLNRNETGFRFKRDGVTYTDLCIEQEGRFAGTEDVELNGKKLYILRYTGADEDYPTGVTKEMVKEVQHGVIITHPLTARFGNQSVELEMEIAEERFRYSETAFKQPLGGINFERLDYIDRWNITRTVYTGTCLLTVFDI